MARQPIIINTLRKGGERITPIRTALIEILGKSRAPHSPQELLAALSRAGFKANKTTVYRQLEVLQRYALVHEVRLADRTARYELAGDNGHHHHLVCLHCGRIEDVSFPTDLQQQEQAIGKRHKFKVLRHALEFFGICQACRGKGK